MRAVLSPGRRFFPGRAGRACCSPLDPGCGPLLWPVKTPSPLFLPPPRPTQLRLPLGCRAALQPSPSPCSKGPGETGRVSLARALLQVGWIRSDPIPSAAPGTFPHRGKWVPPGSRSLSPSGGGAGLARLPRSCFTLSILRWQPLFRPHPSPRGTTASCVDNSPLSPFGRWQDRRSGGGCWGP